ncbi:hypothetical protein SAMN05192574_104154 [Mucilaginibacter gossypiicola]|uniref:FAR-17a/AIG1-like protein n=1 Tax=Mucilaginibacter gossypiicola TaxID=551995 RepID=A0A1H8JE51_9SPHI|nr:Pr6Pr family membrane protein [Mucilaginibacter gossypiicola]SEN78992.1 hypothetical protein SAMN05192574_104154 [Mucilaginibacter gossypiicola]
MEQYKLHVNNTVKGRKWLYVSTVIIWFSLILQIAIAIPNYLKTGRSLAGTLVQLFSYFTILSNLLAVICLTAVLFNTNMRIRKYFLQSRIFTAIALYITIVGLVYNLVLRHLWNPEGLSRLADELLHSVNPVLFVFYWLVYVPKANLKWTQALKWLWFPFIYSVYIFIRGIISHLYPYPFLDIDALGLSRVAINSLLMLIAFLFFGFLFVWINRVMEKRGA